MNDFDLHALRSIRLTLPALDLDQRDINWSVALARDIKCSGMPATMHDINSAAHPRDINSTENPSSTACV